jgi:hypothetical protein
LASLRLRDRDAIVTKEGLIFRVFGYSHPSESYICDAEYAPVNVFKSKNPKAFRNRGEDVFYKFYEDEGWKFVEEKFPQYMIYHEMLRRRVIGVNHNDVVELRKPNEKLPELIGTTPKDDLLFALQSVLDTVIEHTGLAFRHFGVFGSLLHGFHHPKFSDIDLIIYGRRNMAKLCETFKDLYGRDSSPLRNEFETEQSIDRKSWHFQNFSLKEFLWHQRRKLIYAVYDDQKSDRTIKTEFEPVKEWNEITNEYNETTRILQRGWVTVRARVTEDDEAFFIPSLYGIEPQQVLEGPRQALEVKRVVSYMEEFRMQGKKDENVAVEGNLEEVTTSNSSFYQIALTCCPRYYEQVLKVTN